MCFRIRSRAGILFACLWFLPVVVLAQFGVFPPVASGGSGGGGGGASGASSATYTNGTTYYFPTAPGLPVSTTETAAQVKQGVAGTIQNLVITLGSNASTSNLTFTFRDNAASQVVTCSITGATNTCSDLTHNFQQAAGDLTDVQMAVTGANYTGTVALVWATPGQIGPSGANGANGTNGAPGVAAGFGAYSNNGGYTQTICSGTVALGTSLIASGAAATTVTATCTGLLSTDNIMLDFNGSPLAVTGYVPSSSGMLAIIKWPTSNTLNVSVVNNSAASITPGAITLNYRVVR